MSDIEARFALTAERRAIFHRFEAWTQHMHLAGCRTIYLDGSFITNKVEPGDYDACFDPSGIDGSKLDPCLLFRSISDPDTVKQKYGGDIRIDYALPAGTILRYVQFFQSDSRQGGRRKGIVKVKSEP